MKESEYYLLFQRRRQEGILQVQEFYLFFWVFCYFLKCEVGMYLELFFLIVFGSLIVVISFLVQGCQIRICWVWDVFVSYFFRNMVLCGYFVFCFCRENFLVLDVFFEVLIFEVMEQRVVYGLLVFLGEIQFWFRVQEVDQFSRFFLILFSCFLGDFGG